MLQCPNCHFVIESPQDHFYHAGFCDDGFLYCDQDSTLLVFSAFDPTFEAIVGKKVPWTLKENELNAVEQALINCPCGGKFRFSNPPLCPRCKKSIAEIFPSEIHYAVLTRVLKSSSSASVWRLDKVNRAKKGVK